MKARRVRVEVNLQELDQIIDRGRQAPLTDSDGQKLKAALHGMAERLSSNRSTEKTRAVLEQPQASASTQQPQTSIKSHPAGHGRHNTAAFTGAAKIAVSHATLKSGDTCPECLRGKVYQQKQPATRIRIIGRAPLEATVYEMERLRYNACGQIFTAEQPQAAGTDKYDATAVAIIALLKYGTGTPSTAWKSCSISSGCRYRRPRNGISPKPPHNSSGQP
jgi:transposase